jgi:hypothetical protein
MTPPADPGFCFHPSTPFRIDPQGALPSVLLTDLAPLACPHHLPVIRQAQVDRRRLWAAARDASDMSPSLRRCTFATFHPCYNGHALSALLAFVEQQVG